MSATWPRSIRPCESVNGIWNTVGSVPPASWAANVATSHSYSLGSTVMFGYSASNSSTRWRKASRAPASVLGGRLLTEIVTSSAEAGRSALARPAAAWVTASAPHAASTAVRYRFRMIVAPYCSGSGWWLSSVDPCRRVEPAAAPLVQWSAGDQDGPGWQLDGTGGQVDDAGDVAATERQHAGFGSRSSAVVRRRRRDRSRRRAMTSRYRASIDVRIAVLGGDRERGPRRRLGQPWRAAVGTEAERRLRRRPTAAGRGSRRVRGRCPPDWKCIGSWRCSGGRSSTSGRPSSSPWYTYSVPGRAATSSAAARARRSAEGEVGRACRCAWRRTRTSCRRARSG